MNTLLTVEQEAEINLAWFRLAEEKPFESFIGEKIDACTINSINFIARNIGAELTNQFYYYLASGNRIEVTIGWADNFEIVAGGRVVSPPNVDFLNGVTHTPNLYEEEEKS